MEAQRRLVKTMISVHLLNRAIKQWEKMKRWRSKLSFPYELQEEKGYC